MALTVMPSPLFVGIDSSGDPVPSGKLYTYTAGTTSAAGSTTNANPVVLNAAGMAKVYLQALSYKFVLHTSADVEVYTADNVQSTELAAVVKTRRLPLYGTNAVGDNATGFVAGTTSDKLVPGSSTIQIDPAEFSGQTWRLRGMLRVDGSTSTPTVTVSVVNLSSGDTTPLTNGTLTSTSQVGVTEITDGAITWPAGGSALVFGIKMSSNNAANYAFAWGVTLECVA